MAADATKPGFDLFHCNHIHSHACAHRSHRCTHSESQTHSVMLSHACAHTHMCNTYMLIHICKVFVCTHTQSHTHTVCTICHTLSHIVMHPAHIRALTHIHSVTHTTHTQCLCTQAYPPHIHASVHTQICILSCLHTYLHSVTHTYTRALIHTCWPITSARFILPIPFLVSSPTSTSTF
jgi:hypothetical protein